MKPALALNRINWKFRQGPSGLFLSLFWIGSTILAGLYPLFFSFLSLIVTVEIFVVGKDRLLFLVLF